MTRIQQRPDGPRAGWVRIALAALTGVFAGVARAMSEWLLDHIGN